MTLPSTGFSVTLPPWLTQSVLLAHPRHLSSGSVTLAVARSEQGGGTSLCSRRFVSFSHGE